MSEYQLRAFGVIRLSDGASIPPDPENRDWREYLEWVDGGGVPNPEPEPEVDPEQEAEYAALHAVKVKAAKALKLTASERDLLFGPNGDPVPITP